MSEVKNQIKQEQPLVSIVAPMYNVEHYVGEFIECILQQTYTNWELLLVDDGSTDNTIDTVLGYQDDRIKLLRRPENRSKGANACRNFGMENATGEYIIVFDSDDLVEPFGLEQRVRFMEENPEADYATSRGINVYEDTDGTIVRTDREWGVPSRDNILVRLLSTNYPFAVWNNIYRADRIADCKWDEKVQIYQDFDFMVTTVLKKKKHRYIKGARVDYLYREGRPGAITASFVSDAKHVSTMYLFDKIQKSIKKLKDSEKLRRVFMAFYVRQQERLLTGGTKKQYDEFYDAMINEYGNKIDPRIRIMDKVFGSNATDGKMNNPSKKVVYTHLVLFDQKELLNIIKYKLSKVK